MQVSALSLEYVRVRVYATEAGATVNPTADVVTMAFTVSGANPVGGDWKTASWETDSSSGSPAYYARALVGPGGGVITLTAGTTYSVFVKLTDSPEVPIRQAGLLQVT